MKLLVILTFIAIYLISSQKVSAQNGISLDTSISKNVAVVRYDPLIVEQGNRPLSQVYGWGDSTFNSTKFADMMRVATQGVVNYQIVDNIVINKFPLKTDGFRYTWTSYSACRQNTSTCHFPDDASYAELMLRDTNLCQRIQNNQIDEVWLWGGGYFGFDEFAWKILNDVPNFTANPYNAWIYDVRKRDLPACGKTYFVMGWIPEVGFDNQIHSYGHRIESAMTSSAVGRGLWHRCEQGSYWTKYICIDKDSSTNSGCGDVHYPPNGQTDYNYDNTLTVRSSCNQWLNFPTLSSTFINVNNNTWGSDQEGYLRWWISHIPRFAGASSDHVLSNWWRYIVDYDNTNPALQLKTALALYLNSSDSQYYPADGKINSLDYGFILLRF